MDFRSEDTRRSVNLSTFLLHVKIESGAMRFSGGKSLRCFQNKDSSFVFLGTVNGELKIACVQTQNRSKSLKKPLLRQKDDDIPQLR